MGRRNQEPEEKIRRVYPRPVDWERHEMGGPFTAEPAICRRCDLTWYPGVTQIGVCDPAKKGRRFRGEWGAPDPEPEPA